MKRGIEGMNKERKLVSEEGEVQLMEVVFASLAIWFLIFVLRFCFYCVEIFL